MGTFGKDLMEFALAYGMTPRRRLVFRTQNRAMQTG
jgi:hypothetical protein